MTEDASDNGFELEDEPDAVHVLERFVKEECTICRGGDARVRRDEFFERYSRFCQGFGLVPPSPKVLGKALVKCFEVQKASIPIWKGIRFKEGGV